MTTIKSPLAGTRAVLRLNEEAAPEGCVSVMIDLRDGRAFAVPVPTADLLAALDATANTDVAGMRRDLQDELRAARVHYEGELSATRANRDENARLLREALTLRDEWKARAEKAEATVDAVRELLAEADRIELPPMGAQFAMKAGQWFDKLRTTIDPAPVFELPTEAGVRFDARMKCDPETVKTFSTFISGPGRPVIYGYDNGEYGWAAYDEQQVLADFTDHRLIGAVS